MNKELVTFEPAISRLTAGIINSSGFKLNYIVEGQGFPVLVIGSAVYYQRAFSDSITNEFQFVFVDHRGFVPPPVRDLQNFYFDLDVLVDDIELVREQLGLDRFLIIGYSGHAFMALEYAKRYPQHIVGVVMIAVTPDYSDSTHTCADRFFLEEADERRKALFHQNMQLLPQLIEAAPEKRFVSFCLAAGPKSWFNPTYNASWLWEGLYTNMQMFDYVWGEVFRDIDITQGLENFDKPVLLALGKYDFLTGTAYLWDEVKKDFNDLTIRVFEKSAHSPHQEESALFDSILIEWFTNIQSIADSVL